MAPPFFGASFQRSDRLLYKVEVRPPEGGEGFAVITLCGFGVSGYYNKLKLFLLEKEIPFREKLI